MKNCPPLLWSRSGEGDSPLPVPSPPTLTNGHFRGFISRRFYALAHQNVFTISTPAPINGSHAHAV